MSAFTRSAASRHLLVFGPAALMVLAGAVAYFGFRESLAARRWVGHTRDVLDVSSRLLISLGDAESSKRGFLITSDPTFADSAQRAIARSRASIQTLRMLTR